MPGSVRLKLDRAIADHLKVHGARHYDLLRDDPAFAPWIGSHLGARGEKRLDRAIRDVRRFQMKKLGRGAAPTALAVDDALDAAAGEPLEHPAGSPVQRFAAVGAAVVSYDELQGELRRGRRQLEAMMAACLNEDGEPVKPDLYLKLSRERRALITDSANLAKRYHADLNSQAVMERVLARVLEAHAGDPEGAHALITDISNIIRDATGIAATGEGE
ncbi:hypothetical protein LJR219_002712 [Phenylobacterium sp. LjRoot219]|uniref:hypothetical protein n=1 Tax=Phenylobacterium sp. LjRoot219 TaxID=3342283 RepID=UPI003ED102AE